MGWFNRNVEARGMVLFRGPLPPRGEDLESLQSQGIRISNLEKPDGAHWIADVTHPQWGQARVVCPRNLPPPPPDMLVFDPRLTDAEREEALRGEIPVLIGTEGKRNNLLRDRKNMLRFMRAIMGDDGVVAWDHTSQRVWPKAALDDELSHDADLDVDGLYCLHAVGPDNAEKVTWLHTHGLAEIGFFDFDILNPAEELLNIGQDTIRAIAFAIVEGSVTRSTAKHEVAAGRFVRFVDAAEFMRKADAKTRELRCDADEEHNQDRAVLCAPEGLMARWFGGVKPAPALSEFSADEEPIIGFSSEASELMAQRARLSYGMFRKLAAELAEYEFPAIAKVGYRTDGGGETDKEHLWFEVHSMADDHIDATLRSKPFYIAGMKEGDRGSHPVEQLSDWAIMTPLGMINPRDTAPARRIRTEPVVQEALRKALAGTKEES